MNKERLVELSLTSASLITLLAISLNAFSFRVRTTIRERDGNECVDCKELGKHKHGRFHELQASHFNHEHNAQYNDPENGRMQCSPHHWVYHTIYQGKAHEIGLSEEHNTWACETIWKNMNDQERREAQRLLLLTQVGSQLNMFAGV